jgi:hypothetical protein
MREMMRSPEDAMGNVWPRTEMVAFGGHEGELPKAMGFTQSQTPTAPMRERWRLPIATAKSSKASGLPCVASATSSRFSRAPDSFRNYSDVFFAGPRSNTIQSASRDGGREKREGSIKLSSRQSDIGKVKGKVASGYV